MFLYFPTELSPQQNQHKDMLFVDQKHSFYASESVLLEVHLVIQLGLLSWYGVA